MENKVSKPVMPRGRSSRARGSTAARDSPRRAATARNCMTESTGRVYPQDQIGPGPQGAPGVVTVAAAHVQDPAARQGRQVRGQAVPLPVRAPFAVDAHPVEPVGTLAPGVQGHQGLAQAGLVSRIDQQPAMPTAAASRVTHARRGLGMASRADRQRGRSPWALGSRRCAVSPAKTGTQGAKPAAPRRSRNGPKGVVALSVSGNRATCWSCIGFGVRGGSSGGGRTPRQLGWDSTPGPARRPKRVFDRSSIPPNTSSNS